MKMNKIKFYALFMIILILCMPVAFAQATIVDVKVYGQDETDGFIRGANDNTVVEALVSIDGDDLITANQVKIEDIGFSSCIDEGGRFRCKYIEETGFFEYKSYPFVVTLYDDNGINVATKSDSVTADNINPKIIDVIVEQIGGNVKVTYSLTDKACEDESCSGKCSGFKTIDFLGVKQVELNATGQCSFTGTSVLNLESGTYALDINLYDGVGNLGTYKTEPFTVDTTLPTIETNQLLFFKDGKEVSHVGVEDLDKVDVLLYIEEQNLDEVVADLSPLNKYTHMKINYENLKASCNDLGGIQLCRWDDINLLPDSASGEVDVTIKDTAENTVTESVPFNLELDSSQPEVTSIETMCSSGLCYLREKNNTIKMKISESGSGFNRAFWINGKPRYMVALNLGQLSSKYSKEWADECKQEGSNWECYWYNIDVTKSHGQFLKISVGEGSEDDAGNSLGGVFENEFVVDRKAPEQKLIEIGSGSNLDYVLQGEGLNVKLTLTEDSPTRAIGRFGGVINEGREYPVDCANTAAGEYVCEWVKIGSVVPGPMLDAPYEIELIDFSGNSAFINGTVDIVEVEGLPKNYWRYEGSLVARPDAVSEDTLFVAQKVYFLLPLVSSVSDIKVIDAALTGCTVNTGFELNEQVIVNPKGIFVSGTTSAGLDVSYGEITADCTLSVVSVINRRKVAQPQQIPVHLTIPIVNSELGSAGARIDAKIREARDDAKLPGIFNTLEKIYDIAEKICNGLNILTTVTNLFNIGNTAPSVAIDVAIKNAEAAVAASVGTPAFPGAKVALAKLVVAKDAGQTAIEAQKVGFDRATDELKKFCAYISCDRGSFGGKFSNFYNEMSHSRYDEGTGTRTSSNSAGTGPAVGPAIWPSNPKDNLLLSAIMGCIPGIIYNLKKRKQIQCLYVDCLENRVPEGVPIAFCDAQHGYQECRFVYGQIFGAIPFAHVIKQFGDTFRNLFHDPVSLTLGLASIACVGPSAAKNNVCRTIQSGSKYTSVVKDVQGLMESKNLLDPFGDGESPCAKVGLE